jgi:hypothetical protein
MGRISAHLDSRPGISTAKADVRPAQTTDAEKVCSFLAQHMGRGLSAKQYMSLFTYPWMPSPPNRGFLLEASGNVVGYLGAIYADRLVDNQIVRFCNLSNWCVLSSFRRLSTRLLTSLLESTDGIVTNLSPVPEVEEIFEWHGFRVLDEFKWFTFPGGDLPSLIKHLRVSLVTDANQVRTHLTGQELRAFDDHSQIGCGHTVVIKPDQKLYVLSRKRRRKGLTFSEILYASSDSMLRDYFEPLKLSILARDHTFLLACDERLYGKPPRSALRYRRVTLIKNCSFDNSQIDNLYSELALL